jgi:hypothetical protein
MKFPAARPERIAVLLFALARTALCGYRAATQSITVDEATTYLTYVRDHWANIWSNYDPNNHVLYSILAQLSVRALHISEFSLRLPSVLAGFFFVIGIHRVLEATGCSPAIRWITLAAVSVAPLMLDFSVAARGYGLSVTLLVWAIYFSVQGRYLWAGVCAGLGMATTLNVAFSVLGLVAGPVVIGTGRIRARLRRCNSVAEPAAAILFLICYPALRQAGISTFYVGLPTLGESLHDFVSQTVRAVSRPRGWLGSEAAIGAIEHFLLPVVMLFVIAVSVRVFLREPRSRRTLLPAFALLLALGAIVAAHVLLGLNYPIDRLWLHLFVLLALAWAIAVSQVSSAGIRALNGLVAVLLIAQFLYQFHIRFFTLWLADAPSKQVAQYLREDTRGKPPASVAVSATWYMTPALEYYRTVYRMPAIQPLHRPDPTLFVGFDYYALDVDDGRSKIAHTPGTTPLFIDKLSGVMLTK